MVNPWTKQRIYPRMLLICPKSKPLNRILRRKSQKLFSYSVWSQSSSGLSISWPASASVSPFHLLLLVFGYYTVDVFKTFGNTRPELEGDLFLTEVGSISAVFGSLRFTWSAALDKFSYKIVYGTLLVLQMILASTMIFAANSKGMFTTWVCLTIWCEAGHFTLIPNVLKKIYCA